MEFNVPGLKGKAVDYFDYGGQVDAHLIYNCPCGEQSFLIWRFQPFQSLSDDQVRWYVRDSIEMLRRHVISEGNTPNF